MSVQSLRVMVAVSDDPARAFLVDNLAADGYHVTPATGVKHAACRLQDPVDALIVDLDADTVRLIDTVRSGAVLSVDPNVPILALSGAADSFCAIRLLERGADDVLSVPWVCMELRARLAALLRRASSDRPRQLVSVGSLRVDLQARRVWVAEAEIDGLAAKEFELLRALISEPGRVFTRQELLESVWGLGDWTRTRTLDVHVSRLRRRLNVAGESFVSNVWGVGYRLENRLITV